MKYIFDTDNKHTYIMISETEDGIELEEIVMCMGCNMPIDCCICDKETER